MAEKKVEEKKKLGTEDWEEERTRLSDEVKKAQKELWDHTHPVIEDPQIKAQAEYRLQQAEETKKSAKQAPGSWGTEKKAANNETTTGSQRSR